MTETIESVVVVGGGLAGATAATALRARGFSGCVRLICAEEHLPYERPPLSKDFLAGEVPADALLVHPRETYEELDIELVSGRRAQRLRPSEGAVELEDGGQIHADHVVLCTGVRPRRLQVPGEALPGVSYLHDLEDAQELRAAVKRGMPIAVVGEGFIGSEIAATLAAQGVEVTLLMGGELPMQPVLGTEAGQWLREQHLRHGVAVRARSMVRAIHGQRHVEAVELADGTIVAVGAVVIGIGSEPVGQLAIDAGLAYDNGVLVDAQMRTSIPAISAAGDLARFPSPAFASDIRVEHWQNAQGQAASAADSLLGQGRPYNEVPWAWSEQYGDRWEITGLPGHGMEISCRGMPDSADGALWLFSREDRVHGAVALNRRKELRAVRRALETGPIPTSQRWQDESVDIGALLSAPDSSDQAQTA
jgi:3-phenylpropionate/trans-cinnamate dioxygenase ferredoxin reductase subunit